MGTAWKIVPAVVALATLGIVLWQQQMIADLRERVDAVAEGAEQEARAAEMEPEPAPADLARRPAPEPTPEAAPALSEEDAQRLRDRLEAVEGQVSLAMTLLQGVTFRPGEELVAEEMEAAEEEEEEEEEEPLSEEIARLREDVDRLLAQEELTAEEREKLEELIAEAERAPSQRFYDRWSRLEEDLDGVWVRNFGQMAGLSEGQQVQVRDLVDRRRTAQREALQALREGELSPVDVQVELTELDQELRRELRDVLDTDQLERFRRRLQQYESTWIGYR
ncbi:MAG: hypothetical protein ACQEXJ_06455 [Myxococcota bacterium]